MRVCYVTSTVRPREGWGRYSRELILAAPSAGIEPVLVSTPDASVPPLPGTERHDVLPPLFARQCELPRSLLFTPALRRIAKTCQVVHGLVEPWLPLVALAAPRGTPLVQTAHGTWAVAPLSRPLVRNVFSLALARTDLLVCQSRATRDAIAARLSPPPCEVLPGGVRPELFARLRPAASPLPPWVREGLFILSVGALKPRKGHHVALETFSRVALRHADLHWVVVGAASDAAYAAGLVDRADTLGLGHRVHWLSSLEDEDLVAFFQRAALFLLLPVTHQGAFEGLGLVYLEAAAAGRPAVGTLASGAVDAIEDGETGFLVPPEDPDAAAAAVDRLLADRELCLRFGRAARDRANRMSWNHLARELALRYRELVARGAGARDQPFSRSGPS